MKLVVLAGGFGTRLSEETENRPKPMIEIGGKPILWHILKMYSAHGINEFVICLGYKGYQVKEYFANYYMHLSDIAIDLGANAISTLQSRAENWKITLVDTGLDTMTGGRLKLAQEHIGDETFCMTYGDGVADVDVTALLDFHRRSGCEATVTAVRPPARFGALELSGEHVSGFAEKPVGDGGWVSGGFFVLSPSVFDRIDGPHTTWEKEPLEGLTRERQLAAYRHDGFWQPMDTLRDKRLLEKLWESGEAKWKVW